MITKLRENYKLSDLIIRILFVGGYLFANWQTTASVVNLMVPQSNIWYVVLVGIMAGILWMCLLPFVINIILNVARLYSVPRAEFCLIAMFCMCVNYVILGLFNLVNLFTPLLMVWISVIAPVISALVAGILFYKITSVLYFNDASRVFYFKLCGIVFFAYVAFRILMG